LPAGATPAIVTAEIWQAAQNRLAANAGQTARNQNRPYLLRGMVLCGVCNRSMWSSPEKGRRTYRCSSRSTPDGPCGGRRAPAELLEEWAWGKISAVLRDPSIIAQELERRREAGPDKHLEVSLENARRHVTKVEQQQQRLIRQFRMSENSAVPWELVEREVAQAQKELEQWKATVADLEQRLRDQQAEVLQLDALKEYCQRVSQNLDDATFEDQRMAFEALGVRITANARDWTLNGNVPIDQGAGVVATTC
jgi:hypothetical protein